MPAPYAFVTLITSDQYLPGGLALAAALKDVHPHPTVPPEVDFQTVCLVTPETVDVSTIKLLRRAFDVVVGVELIEQEDEKGLQLLGRPDLSHVLTKLHLFRLTQYAKLIFLDADVLPIRPLSHLFTLPHEFAAVPDVGWPDIFNSGVFVASPGQDKFDQLIQLLKSKGSWDGGDQGLLNEWRGGNWYRLSFTYNTTPTAAYTYAPAYERFGSQISAIHFIGPHKPWSTLTYRAPGTRKSAQQPNWDPGASPDEKQRQKQQVYDFDSLVDRWYQVYDKHYRSDLPTARAEFEVRRYASAWDDGTGSEMGAEMPPVASAGVAAPPGGALGLEDLRKIAVEGMSNIGGGVEEVEGPKEGEYRSMPLEGRVDLMRPRHEPEHEWRDEGHHSQEGGDRDLTPRQEEYKTLEGEQGDSSMQGQYESQSAPYPHGGSSPPRSTYYPPHLQAPPVAHHGQSGQQQQHQHSQQYPPSQQHQQGQHEHSQGHQHYHSPSQQQQNLPGHQHQQQEAQHYAQHHQHHAHSPSGQHHEHHDGSHDHGHQDPQPQHQHQTHSHSPTQHSPQRHHHHHHRHSPPRPPSPPKLSWNPAIEPPPNNPPTVHAFPTDTYFPNVWDAAPSQQHDATYQSFAPPSSHNPAPHSDAFFHPPPPAHIPEHLVRQGQYANVIGHSPPQGHDSGSPSPQPDRNKVHAVFPWESKPRHVPRRVFPASDSPPPAVKYIEDEPPTPPQPAPIVTVTSSDSRPILYVQTPSPTVGLPGNLAYANAWDSVPSIQKYASRLVRPHHVHHAHNPHAVAASPQKRSQFVDDEGWKRWEKERERIAQAKQDASSMDGDDEDEGSEDDGWEDTKKGDGGGSRGGSAGGSGGSSRRSRAGSSASVGGSAKGKKYRGRGVQTIAVETRSQGVQVKLACPNNEATASTDIPETGPSKLSIRMKRDMASSPMMNTSLLPAAPVRDYRMDPDQMGLTTPLVSHALKHTVPFPSAATPTGLRSPQTLGSPRTYSPPKVATPPKAPSPPRITSPSKLSTPPRMSPTPKVTSPPKVATPPNVTSPPKGTTPRKLSSAQQQEFSSPRRGSTSLGTPPSKSASPSVGPAGTPPPGTPSPKLSRLSSPFSPPLARSSSNETAFASSPSTQGPVLTPQVTPENTPIMGSMRKGGRVWDPARGVDVFKRSSEEVLARFLRMGSFEDDERRQGQGQMQPEQ